MVGGTGVAHTGIRFLHEPWPGHSHGFPRSHGVVVGGMVHNEFPVLAGVTSSTVRAGFSAGKQGPSCCCLTAVPG